MGNLCPDALALNLCSALHQSHVALLPVEAVLAGIPGLKALLIPDSRALNQLTLLRSRHLSALHVYLEPKSYSSLNNSIARVLILMQLFTRLDDTPEYSTAEAL